MKYELDLSAFLSGLQQTAMQIDPVKLAPSQRCTKHNRLVQRVIQCAFMVRLTLAFWSLIFSIAVSMRWVLQ
jgi:hypothetical protein